jgi:hypothetical protein
MAVFGEVRDEAGSELQAGAADGNVQGAASGVGFGRGVFSARVIDDVDK